MVLDLGPGVGMKGKVLSVLHRDNQLFILMEYLGVRLYNRFRKILQLKADFCLVAEKHVGNQKMIAATQRAGMSTSSHNDISRE